MMNMYQFMTKDQFQQSKSQALSRNLKTKHTPKILSHSFMFHLRRNNLTEALGQIDRAINLKKERENGVEIHIDYVDFYLKRAQIMAKMRRYEEAEIDLKKAQEIRSKVFGLKREEDRE